jgi:hypothetical protein
MNALLFRKLIVEFIGTFFLVYVVSCVSLQEHLLLGPLAIGASLMVMIFAGGHIITLDYSKCILIGSCRVRQRIIHWITRIRNQPMEELPIHLVLPHPVVRDLMALHSAVIAGNESQAAGSLARTKWHWRSRLHLLEARGDTF